MAHDKKVYEGSALAKQAPADGKLSRAKEFESTVNAGNTLIKKLATLLSKDLPLNALTQTYHLINNDWLKSLGGMRDTVNSYLKEYIEEQAQADREALEKGEEAPSQVIHGKTESGGSKYEMSMDFANSKFRVTGTKARATKPDIKLLAERLLKNRKAKKPDRDVSLSQCESDITDVVTEYVYSEDKVRKLIDKGVLTTKDVELSRPEKPGMTLKVDKL